MGKVVGGTSKLNSLVYLRGHTRDYDLWAEHGSVGWAYENVLPYFKKSENYQGKFKKNSKLNDCCVCINLNVPKMKSSLHICNFFKILKWLYRTACY